jgi:benzoyl-CoA reductase/2-hydroxyglutaryl-CoA dehydratase subunit BcrC/BadD/HgdB
VTVKALKGLAQAREINQNRAQRVKELQQEGKKIFGYLCIYPILEMLTAFDIVPFRLFGDINEPVTKANNFLPTVVCPFLRSYLDLGLKGRYSFLDGIITSHICDVGAGVPAIWNYAIKTPYTYHIDTPHTTRESAREYHRKLMDSLQASLEEYTGRKLETAKLAEAIEKHNRQRALVRELYDLKKPAPPLLSGAETVQVIKAIQSLPVEEGSRLLREVIEESKARKDGPVKKTSRLMIWGSILDNSSLVEMIESLDANVVMDDTCVGSRPYFDDVKITPNPLDGLANHYLNHIKCPRTFMADYFAQQKDYASDLKRRYGYLGDYARDWHVNGVIMEALKYCDTHGYEVPSVKDYFQEIELPTIYLEHDYTLGMMSPLKTRVQGFLEIIA